MRVCRSNLSFWTPLLLLPLLLPGLATSQPSLAQAPAQTAHAARAMLSRPALPPVPGEVIVRFRDGTALLRGDAADETGAARRLRAERLSARLGQRLASGEGLGARTQVLRAEGGDAAALAARLAADPDVLWAEPNHRRRRLSSELHLATPVPAPDALSTAPFVPADPLYTTGPPVSRPLQQGGPVSGQWYLQAPTSAVVSGVDMPRAWARTLGREDIVVAVLDTGVRFEHPDLGRAATGGRLLPGYDMVSDSIVANDGDGRDADPSDPGDWVSSADRINNRSRFGDCDVANSSWHGTATASLVAAAADGQGMVGGAPGTRVLPVRVLGKCYGTDADIIAGMRWAAGLAVDGVPANPHPARVINMSLGSTGSCNAAYQAAVDEITAAGTLIVAAAGNSAGGPVGVPGNCRGVLTVLALRHAGTKVGFSDLGPQISIAAPGGNCVDIGPGDACLYPILAATNSGAQGPVASAWTDSFDITVGTSFSSPLVAATAGLMLSLQPALQPDELRTRLQATARPFPSTGADNGDDPTPVTACVAPRSDVVQLQCYCSTALCGAGMLDAGAAVAMADALLARIAVLPAAPRAGQAVQLSGADSLAAVAGPAITGWAWSVVSAGGIVNGFSTATNAPTASLLPTAAGRFTVRLTVTDSGGSSASTDREVVVAAAAPTPPPPPPPAAGGGGGGAAGGGWLLALAAATALLHRRRR
jgi:serine protease